MSASLATASGFEPAPARMQYLRIPGEPEREYYAYVPASAAPGADPLVLVHGISRNAAELVLRFAGLARVHGVPLIAPLFTRARYGQYQQLAGRRGKPRCDVALGDILTDAARRFATGRIALFGFSGGAQLAHRFAMIHPHRVRMCVPVSAGWYTLPDETLAWPLGLAGASGAVEAAAARVPFHIIVGARDTGDDDALRRDAEIDRLQGEDRRSRARAWHRALRKSGWNPRGSLIVLPRTGHNFGCAHRHGLTQTVFGLLGHDGDPA